jgi:hypothetical protein
VLDEALAAGAALDMGADATDVAVPVEVPDIWV